MSLAVATLASVAPAQTSPDELARRHFESGVAYLQESDYDNALKAFEKAYELSKRPAILLNMATVHERRGDLQAAVQALELYLNEDPEGEHVATVELRVANLKKRIEEAPPPEPQEQTAQPAPEPAAVAPAPVQPGPPPPTPPPEADRKAPSRVPAYVLLTVGALSAGGATITGLMARNEYDDADDPETGCSPNCTDDELSSGRTLALTSTILTGVSVISVGVGAVLLLTGGSQEAPPPAAVSAVPALRLLAAPGQAAASATWRF